jgi:hypothetical protein
MHGSWLGGLDGYSSIRKKKVNIRNNFSENYKLIFHAKIAKLKSQRPQKTVFATFANSLILL